MSTRRVWVINAIDGLPGEGFKINRYPNLASAFANAGWETTWITSDFSHYGSGPRALGPEAAGLPYQIALVHVRGYPPGINVARFLNNREFRDGVLRWARAPGRPRPDLVVASHPTPEGLAAGRLLAQEHGAMFVADVRDPWPDTFEAVLPQRLGTWGRRLRPVLVPAIRLAFTPWRRRIADDLRAASALLAVSSTYAEWAQRLAPSIRETLVAPLGAAVPDAHRPARGAHPETVTMAYVGVLSASFDWATMERAIPLARARDPRLRFWLIGDGSLTPVIEQTLATREDLRACVTLFGMRPHEEVRRLLADADIGLHGFVPGATQSITNKLIDFSMAGLAIANSQAGEAEHLLREVGVGMTYRPGDAASLADTLVDLAYDGLRLDAMGQRSRALAVERFGAPAVYRSAVSRLIELWEAREGARAPG